MNLLLIWQCIPETTTCYIFKCDSVEADLARRSAGKYINTTEVEDDHAIHHLNEILEQLVGLDSGDIMKGPFSEVVICGFLC